MCLGDFSLLIAISLSLPYWVKFFISRGNIPGSVLWTIDCPGPDSLVKTFTGSFLAGLRGIGGCFFTTEVLSISVER